MSDLQNPDTQAPFFLSRTGMRDSILSNFTPKHDSLIMGEESLKEIDISVISREHLADLLTVCFGYDETKYQGFGNPNVAHSRIAHIVLDAIAAGVSSSFYDCVQLSHDYHKSLPQGIEEAIPLWRKDLLKHLLKSKSPPEVGFTVNGGDKKQIIGVECFGNDLAQYEKVNTRIYLVTKSTGPLLDAISAQINEPDGYMPDGTPYSVSKFKPGSVIEGEGRKQYPNRSMDGLEKLVRRRINMCWEQTGKDSFPFQANLEFYSVYSVAGGLLSSDRIPVKDQIQFVK